MNASDAGEAARRTQRAPTPGATEAASRAPEQEREAARRTNEFLAMLAHELRNPLAAIVSSLPLLERVDANATEKAAHELIRRQTMNLRRLVDDLLDAARVTQGRIELRHEIVELNELVRRVAANVEREKTAPRNQALHLELPESSLTVRGDAIRLEQVLTNVLDNASKFSDTEGVIDLTLTQAREPSGAEIARIVVRDRGIGMAPGTLPTIFDIFSQANVPLARSRGGLGIGLTLVRTLVELHGGTTRARSEGLGQGSEIEITLPMATAQPSTPAASLLPRAAHAASQRRILIVEDNHDAQQALQYLLQSWGHEVLAADEGRSGFQRALDLRPDVALVDLGLPGMDGYEVARKVREALGPAAPLLIALTGYGAPEQRKQALAAGFDLHIVKPVEPERLATLLEEYAATPPTSAQQEAEHEQLETTATNLRYLS